MHFSWPVCVLFSFYILWESSKYVVYIVNFIIHPEGKIVERHYAGQPEVKADVWHLLSLPICLKMCKGAKAFRLNDLY